MDKVENRRPENNSNRQSLSKEAFCFGLKKIVTCDSFVASAMKVSRNDAIDMVFGFVFNRMECNFSVFKIISRKLNVRILFYSLIDEGLPCRSRNSCFRFFDWTKKKNVVRACFFFLLLHIDLVNYNVQLSCHWLWIGSGKKLCVKKMRGPVMVACYK